MKYNRNFRISTLILTLSIIALTIIGFFNNANAIFHLQSKNNQETLDSSKDFIINLFDNVNKFSNEYQKELDKQKELINNDKNNRTLINNNNEYISNLSKVISLAKNYNVDEEYKTVLDHYINSLQNEIESYRHYNNFILTNNNTENKLSLDLLSNALNYETEAIKKFKELQEQ
jgi:hypothetical protein